MAFNPSPKVADARKIAGEWDKEQIIIFAIDGDEIEYASYGKNKGLCNEAKRLGDVCFDAIMEYFKS